MTEMFGEAWPPMSVPDLAPDDDDDDRYAIFHCVFINDALELNMIYRSWCMGFTE